ncbi:Acyl-CoA thioesterase 8 [Orbilia blumenaviensis]|uniref:Acyl-CoA thioesterase 8 n=1 Tax=Orbilia blumenaviensis TaxID=1796055 RepID=A0AAV9UGF4_9PEZI
MANKRRSINPLVPLQDQPAPILQQIEVSTAKDDSSISISDPVFHYLPTRSVSIFGGQVIAQAILAAWATVQQTFDIHSIHCAFIDRTDPAEALTYRVSSTRTGRTIANRLVNAFQHTRLVFMATMSFHRFESNPVLKYSRALPSGFPPLNMMNPVNRSDYYQMIFQDCLKDDDKVLSAALDAKHLMPSTTTTDTLSAGLPRPKSLFKQTPNMPIASTKRNKACSTIEEFLRSGSLVKAMAHGSSANPRVIYQYIKVNGILPDDSGHRAAAFAMASDTFSSQLPAVLIPNKNLSWITSLDHSIYFHKPFNPCYWLAVENIVSVADGGRSLVEMRYWTENGELVATAMQEGLFRAKQKSKI